MFQIVISPKYKEQCLQVHHCFINKIGQTFLSSSFFTLYSRRHEKCKVNKKTRIIVRFYAIFILKKTGDMYVPSG